MFSLCKYIEEVGHFCPKQVEMLHLNENVQTFVTILMFQLDTLCSLSMASQPQESSWRMEGTFLSCWRMKITILSP